MTITKHELRQGKVSFLVWTASVGFLLSVCVFLFPEMQSEMDNVTKMFSSMGVFSKAFGMDKLNFGTLIGYYCIECGNVLGLGGAFFASLCAVSILSKEEAGHTAEFLLTHPVSRARIVAGKLAAVLVEIAAMNLVIYAVSIASITAIGEAIPWRELNLLHLAYFLMQFELAGICFGLSAFLRKGSAGAGLGLAAFMYFLDLIANVTDSAAFLKYFTPFGFCEGAYIVSNTSLNAPVAIVGVSLGAAGIIAGFLKYTRKDMR